MVTNFLEAEVEKYQRRVRRIEENPDPTKLRANGMLYRIELDKRVEHLEGARRGEPFAYTMLTEEILEMMGIHCLGLSRMADRASAYAEEYLAVARSHGVTENICDRYRVALGMILSKAVPWPSLITGASGACTVEMQMLAAASIHCKVPSYIIDRYIEPDGERRDYLLHQIREMIEFVEHTVPGAKKFDEDVLQERIEQQAQAQKYLRVLYEAAKQVPSPLRGQDMLRIPHIGNACQPGGLEYFKTLSEEIGERASKGFAALKEEKARAMWLVTSTFYDDVMTILEERGVAVPIYEWDTINRSYGLGESELFYEQKYLGKKTTPLEEFMRIITAQAWAGPGDRWVQRIVKHARDFKIDMLVYFMLSGCPTNLLEARIVADTVEKELGIPTLMIDGYMMDRTKYTRDEFKAKLNEFVDYVFQKKGIK